MLLSRKLRRAYSQPITLIGSEQIQNAVNSTSITINKPSGTMEGDLLIVLLFSHDFGADIFVPPDANWNLLIASHMDGVSRHCDVFYKIATASEASSYTFTYANSRLYAGAILTYRNAQIGFRGELAAGSTTSLTIPEIKIPINNSLLLSVSYTDDQSITFSTPTGMSSVVSNSDATKPSYKICSQDVNSGLTGDKTVTYTGTTGYGVLFSLISKNYTPRTISYIGSANTQSTSSGVTSLSINKPSNVQEGDLMLAFMATTSSESWSGDTGWTEIVDQINKPAIRIAYKYAGNSEPSSYTFTTGTTTNSPAGSILAFRNALYDTSGALVAAADPITLTSIDAIENYDFLLAFFAGDVATRTWDTPTYMSSLVINNDSTSPSYAIFYQQIGYGATGQRESSLNTSTNVGGIMLTIKLN